MTNKVRVTIVTIIADCKSKGKDQIIDHFEILDNYLNLDKIKENIKKDRDIIKCTIFLKRRKYKPCKKNSLIMKEKISNYKTIKITN